MPVMSYHHTLSLSPTANSSTATATHDPSVTTVNDDPTIAVSATSTLTEGSVSAGDTVHTFNIADEETADDTLTLTLSNTTYYAVANNDDGTATVTLTGSRGYLFKCGK